MSHEEAAFYVQQADKALKPGWLSFTSSAPDIAGQFYAKAAEEYEHMRNYEEALSLYERAAQCFETGQAFHSAFASRKAAALLTCASLRRDNTLTSHQCCLAVQRAAETAMKTLEIDHALEILKKGTDCLLLKSKDPTDEAAAAANFLTFEMVRLSRRTGSGSHIADALLSVSEASIRSHKCALAADASREVLSLRDCPQNLFAQAALTLIVLALDAGDIVEARKRFEMVGEMSEAPQLATGQQDCVLSSSASRKRLGLVSDGLSSTYDPEEVPVLSSDASFFFTDVGRRVNALLEAYENGEQESFNDLVGKLHGASSPETSRMVKMVRCPTYTSISRSKLSEESEPEPEPSDIAAFEPDDGLR